MRIVSSPKICHLFEEVGRLFLIILRILFIVVLIQMVVIGHAGLKEGGGGEERRGQR